MMKKLWFQWFILLLTLSFSVTGQEVEISMDHPGRVQAGEDFMVTVNIHKGSLSDYSRFSQDLPYGLTASNVNSPNADFSFDNQRIRIIWLKLPDEETVKVTYRVTVHERLKGTFVLGGVFAYVVEDERKFLNFKQSGEIAIVPDPSVDPALVVDIKDFRETLERGPAAGPGEPYAMVIRQEPEVLTSGGYLVRLLIRNPDGSRYAKIEETIPSGYIFEKVDSHGAIESFAAGTVKFIWMRLPEEQVFEVVYRLVPKRDEPQGNMEIEGLFTYTIGDDSRVTGIKQVDVPLEQLSQPEKRNLLLTGHIPGGTQRQGDGGRQQASGGGSGQQGSASQTTGQVGTAAGSVRTPEQGTSQGAIAGTSVLPAGTGTYFRVQLIATGTAFDASSLFRGRGLDREVYVEQHEGLYKYTAGSFQTYREAAQYRDRVETIPEVEGPFVVAYRNGRRIPVDPAQR